MSKKQKDKAITINGTRGYWLTKECIREYQHRLTGEVVSAHFYCGKIIELDLLGNNHIVSIVDGMTPKQVQEAGWIPNPKARFHMEYNEFTKEGL